MKHFLAVIISLSGMVHVYAASNDNLNQNRSTFQVRMVPAVNGKYTVTPKVPEDGKVPAGTEITIKATPSAGYSLDAVFYTVKGGMWGTSSYESFLPEMKITVDKDMSVGATFVETALVRNISVNSRCGLRQTGR